jgi:glycosyltransferase involved in cell wall biosynthesis
MARILFVHNKFPGRFEFLLPALKAAGHEMAAIAQGGRQVDDIPLLPWRNERPNTPEIFLLALRAETDLMRGRAAADCALQLRDAGFKPDLIIGHPAWGETAFIGEVFPTARQILVGEFYYRAKGADVGFDPEFEQPTIEDDFKVHAKNAIMAMAYVEADIIVCPTRFQASVFPTAFQDRIEIIHEGIDSARIKRIPGAQLRIRGNTVLDGSAPVITFVNRVFEPMRGFHIMMRALPAVLDAVRNVHILMIGSDKTRGYGLTSPDGRAWRSHMMHELGDRIDRSRVVFTGTVPHETMLSALSISWAHVYYTYPFVLSWSLLEAMATECLVLGSDTPPVRDAIENGVNGILNGFFDVGRLSQAMVEACQDQATARSLRKKARESILERFDQHRVCRPAWLRLIEQALPAPRRC